MNLSNSICGPDGCIDYISDPNNPSHFTTPSTDHGHAYFVIVCAAAVGGAATVMGIVFLVSRAASGDPFWTRALRVKGKTLKNI